MSGLRRNAGWALAGNAGYAACQWGIVMTVAKHAAPADLGRFALALAVTSPIVMLTNLQLRAVQATDARRETPFGVYLGVRLASVGVAWLAIAAVTAASGYERATATLIAAMALAKGVEAVADVVFGLQQQHENLRRIAGSLLLKGAGSVAIVALVLGATGDLVSSVLAMAAWWAAVLVAMDLRGAARLAALRPVWRPAVLAPLAWLALPLGFVMGLNSFAVNVPRYAVAAHLGPEALGYFSAAAYLLVAGSQPMLAIGAALSPRLARLHGRDRRAYRALALRGLGAAAALGVTGIVAASLAGRTFMAIAYAPAYAAHADLLVWLAVAAAVGFLSTGLGVAVTAARRFRIQLATAAASLALGAVAAAVLVPRVGLLGAALALLASELTRLICLGAVFAGECRARPEEIDGLRIPGSRPRRILHVFGAMDRGGAETRTLEIMRRIDRAEYRFDFCVLSGRPGAYAAEIAALGGTVIPCPLAPRWSFALRLLRMLRSGRYDVVHSHVHQFSGPVLLLARLAAVPIRIAHLRSVHDGRGDDLARRAYRRAARAILERSATTVVAVSTSAMEAFWGADWEHDPRRRVIYNGVDVARFAKGRGPDVRAELGIPSDARVVLHVGSFTPAKNHAALVGIAAALDRRRSDDVFVLVGDGALRPRIEVEVAAHGLGHRFRFTGSRDDVPALLAAADVLVLPSRWEGLPGVVLEASACGVAVVASPLAAVAEIGREIAGIHTADPADAAGFAAVLDDVLQREASRRGSREVRGLPPMFATETSMRRLLECYR
ncbi:MAG: glycosyltransferase [Deltaproteobacteria bacterium]|nr:glycosyltransferase [Deltaproteobacteria bacterium]